MRKEGKIIGRAGNNKFLKEFNQAGVLDLIRLHGTISRAEISNLTGLSPTAAGTIVSALLEKGYIHEVGEGKSSGGRRPILLELMPRSFFSAGIDLDVDGMRVILIDITGTIIYESFYPLRKGKPFPDVIRKVSEITSKITDEVKIKQDRLLGVGISIPGIIDTNRKRIIFAPNMEWNDIDMEACLYENFNVPIYVENEAMASAVCENWIGCCRDLSDFICINIGTGIGSGIFTGGRLYRGVGGSAGEVGHIVVNENGPECGCGNYGCLETMASTVSIIERVKKLSSVGSAEGCRKLHDNLDKISLDSVVESARNGDEAVRAVLMESAGYIGIAISYIINMLNPSKIVLGKEFVKYADLVIDYVKSVVIQKALKHPQSHLKVEVSDIGEKSSALGAAFIPLKVLFGR